ncbi:hypothetical protein ACJIZ3_014949 [Penstemon smallii]|uniref:X8 domain-containing protein n=1 Tax=Penstemon smallii TaxID=265156 RepID=A0ABD3RP72_9LAMI
MNAHWFLPLFSFSFSLLLSSTVKAGQESVRFLTFETSSENGLPLAIQVQNEHLKNVSFSLLMAENWVRTHVLAHYPAKNVSIIIIGHDILCRKNEEKRLGLVLPAIKNIYYSLTRWGLQNDIKVSTTFAFDCFGVDLAENYIKPLVNTLDEIGSPYVVNSPQELNILSDETLILLKSHIESMKKLGFVHMDKINMIVSSPRMHKTVGRKLSFIDSNSVLDPYPQRPRTLIAPTHAPLPPLIGIVSPPPNSLPFAPSLSPVANPTIPPFLPHLAPMMNPATPPFGPHLPPCNPFEGGGSPVGAPAPVAHNGVWCVAKPSVPSETLQEALDYACGEGGADCEAITPHGSCYFPDSLVAHASYAFNSYWQKTKNNGGICGFGGTAMLINSDPSKHMILFCFGKCKI